jgi:hypothetical protein
MLAPAACVPNEMQAVIRLRNLAAWYREFADKAAAPWIWEARLLRAEELDGEADLIAERASVRSAATTRAACDAAPLVSRLKDQ